MACIALAAAALLALPSLQAGEELEFAVPDDGRVTLGVFDSAGKLVRLLHKLAREEDFRIGDNGLITTWDGKNDAGERMASGHYYVRGYLIGDDVLVSGENFLFNDWAADDGFPGFNRIKDFALLENGDVILLAGADSNHGGMAAVPSQISDSAGNKWAQTAQRPPGQADGIPSDNLAPPAPSENLLASFSPEKGFLWSSRISPDSGLLRIPTAPRTADSAGHPLGGSVVTFLPPSPHLSFTPLLATNLSLAFVITDGGTGIYSLDDGKKTRWIAQGSGVPPLALAANESHVFISSNGTLAECLLPELSSETISPIPSTFTSLDADAATLVGASPDGVWIRKGAFAPVKLPTGAKSVALGTPDTFWFVGVEKETSFVGQASSGGEILRLLRPADGDPKPDKIRASRTSEKFAVIESLPGVQRLRVMERAESGEWTIEWERTLRESGAFGFADGKPVADAAGAPQDKSLRVRLKENPLTGKHDFLTLRAEFDESGSRLVSPDGLPLVEVSTRNDIRRIAIHRGDKSDALRLLQGNGSFVEEFSISGLDDILPLDAGGIDLP
ncbi:MAG: hypothetical protein NTV93_11810 [Verrucomicrobia bacterium]|nr:hypothetical protein [Verrucomicrobiota bacterium]